MVRNNRWNDKILLPSNDGELEKVKKGDGMIRRQRHVLTRHGLGYHLLFWTMTRSETFVTCHACLLVDVPQGVRVCFLEFLEPGFPVLPTAKYGKLVLHLYQRQVLIACQIAHSQSKKLFSPINAVRPRLCIPHVYRLSHSWPLITWLMFVVNSANARSAITVWYVIDLGWAQSGSTSRTLLIPKEPNSSSLALIKVMHQPFRETWCPTIAACCLIVGC
jgi:hypothetical protein